MRRSVTDIYIYIYIYTHRESLVRNHEPCAKALGNNVCHASAHAQDNNYYYYLYIRAMGRHGFPGIYLAALDVTVISSLQQHNSTSTIDVRMSTHRSSMIDTSIIDFRRSTHRSPKVDTPIFESRHIDRRSSKVDTLIIDLRKSTHRSSKIEGVNIAPTIRHRILSTTALHSIIIISIIRSYTRAPILTCVKINNI